MGTFDFWQRWLLASCVLFGGVGILVATISDAFLFDLWNAGLDAVFADHESLGAEAIQVKTFLLGPLGGTMLGSYVLCGFIVAGPFRRREPWAWWAVALSLVSWFILDSSVSIAHGAWFNVYLINLVALVGQGLPLLMTAGSFRGTPVASNQS